MEILITIAYAFLEPVKKGAPLYKLDPAPTQARLDDAKAIMAKANSCWTITGSWLNARCWPPKRSS